MIYHLNNTPISFEMSSKFEPQTLTKIGAVNPLMALEDSSCLEELLIAFFCNTEPY